jgi:hypothetical protein
LPKRAETFRKTPLKLPRFPPARLNDHVFRIPEIPKNTHSDRYRGRARPARGVQTSRGPHIYMSRLGRGKREEGSKQSTPVGSILFREIRVGQRENPVSRERTNRKNFSNRVL